MGENMKRVIALAGLALAVAVAAIAFAVPAMAGNGNGAVITNTAAVSIPNQTGYNFDFWNGNGVIQPAAPTYFQEVLTPSGVHNQVLKGTVANDTGGEVVYSAYSGYPIPTGQTCFDFANGHESTGWTMTIDASGHYTLACHFPA
jgi:hypothetical protein